MNAGSYKILRIHRESTAYNLLALSVSHFFLSLRDTFAQYWVTFRRMHVWSQYNMFSPSLSRFLSLFIRPILAVVYQLLCSETAYLNISVREYCFSHSIHILFQKENTNRSKTTAPSFPVHVYWEPNQIVVTHIHTHTQTHIQTYERCIYPFRIRTERATWLNRVREREKNAVLSPPCYVVVFIRRSFASFVHI